jgi:hypothetical protein
MMPSFIIKSFIKTCFGHHSIHPPASSVRERGYIQSDIRRLVDFEVA